MGLASLLQRDNPVVAAAKAFTTAQFVVSGEYDGRSVRGSGAVDMRRDRARLEMAESAPGLEHARGEGIDVVYVGDKQYLRTRFTEYTEEGEFSPWFVSRVERSALDPRAELRELRAVEYLQDLGEERVRDVPTTRYRAQVGPRTTTDVWIDERGRIARLGSERMSVFYTYGKPVTISVPDVNDRTPSD